MERTLHIKQCTLYTTIPVDEKNQIVDDTLHTTLEFDDGTTIFLEENKPTHPCPSHVTGSCSNLPTNEFKLGCDKPQTDIELFCEKGTCNYFNAEA